MSLFHENECGFCNNSAMRSLRICLLYDFLTFCIYIIRTCAQSCSITFRNATSLDSRLHGEISRNIPSREELSRDKTHPRASACRRRELICSITWQLSGESTIFLYSYNNNNNDNLRAQRTGVRSFSAPEKQLAAEFTRVNIHIK